VHTDYTMHQRSSFNGCILNHRSRFVRRDRSRLVKKNVRIFLVLVGVVILFSLCRAPQTMPSFKSKQTTPAPGSTDGRG